MLNIIAQGRDFYSSAASIVYEVPYEECTEKDKNGKHSDIGYERRQKCKAIVLGLNYGRSVKSIAEQCKMTLEEAQALVDRFSSAYPGIDIWRNIQRKFCRENGYVKTICGNRRYIPNLALKPVEVSTKNSINFSIFDVLFDNNNYTVEDEEINKIETELSNCKYWEYKGLCQKYVEQGYIIKNNKTLIDDADREVVNSIIQGSAANVTKFAMIKLFENEELKKFDTKLILQIHDEVVVECPKKYANKVAKIVGNIMSNSAKELLGVKMKTDCEIMDRWNSEIEVDESEEE